MKCENCGKNEVTFVYQSNINGKSEETHLCSECAEKLGYTQKIAAHSQRMMQSFFDDFFSPAPSLMGRSSWLLDDPFEDFFSEMPALGAPQPAPQQQEDLVNSEEQSHFSYLRQMNALRMEMKKAVHREDFERAAQLRDQIHQLEAEHKEQKETN